MATREVKSGSNSPQGNTETNISTDPSQDQSETPGSTGGSQSHGDQQIVEHDGLVDDLTAARKVLDLAGRDDKNESSAELLGKINRSQIDSVGQDLLERERERGTLEQRSRQAILHVTFTELRIKHLEKELRELKAKVYDRPDDAKFGRPRIKQCAVYAHVLKRSTQNEFQLTSHSMQIPEHEQPALEVEVTDFTSPTGIQDSPGEPRRRNTGLLGLADQRTPEKLRIRSLPLIAHLERVCRETISNNRVRRPDNQNRLAPVVLLRPFKLVFAYEQEIRESVQQIESLAQSAQEAKAEGRELKGTAMSQEFAYSDLLEDLKLLIEFMDVELKATSDLRRDIRDDSATDIQYADLWHLFELGDVVVSTHKKSQAFRVLNFTGGREKLIYRLEDEKYQKARTEGFLVDCCSVCFDGTDYVPKLEQLAIRKFTGRRPITSLEVYPMRFDENCESMRREFVSQGQRYLEMTRSPFVHRMYNGRTLDEPPQELEAQVIVDVTLAVNAEESWRLTRSITEEDLTENDPRETQIPPSCEHDVYDEGCCGSDYIFKDLDMNASRFAPFRRDYGGLFSPRSADELKEDDILLLPYWIHGFVLRSRQWATLRLSDLSEVQFDNDFDELMFSDSHKRTILALVETHESARKAPAAGTQTVGAALDLVKGKGTGLIILLHGEPGVGKTSTAECVADKTERPLFPITCGDIGETATEVERNLYHNFRLAHKWGCVLLLDEADVFLAKRNKSDLRRNAVTSVFLRSLEYYAGILFLTTNRVGGIDPAFKSRIHLSLHYPRLDLEATLELYRVFIRRTRSEQDRVGLTQFKIKDKEILRFAKQHFRQAKKEGFSTWNGRQIRNAFQTAIALAEHEAAEAGSATAKPVLGKAQFDVVALGSKEFDMYLRRTLQGADDEIAIRDQWRDDHFTDPVPKAFGKRASRVAFLDQDESVDDDSEDDTESEDDDDDDGDEDEHGATTKLESRTGKPNPETDTASKKRADSSSIDLSEIGELLKAMRKAKGKKT
ncbi:AAA family ATPase [Pleurostoma richardsiae]|uniref:AAA family ATPase n=1 Tax=Pleurostoma richardsiae TaxID=41990 RepID=A0AA38VW80_9PEZI|nr:AAA family ATPase [Pleurostoma richardsiae]